MVILAALQILFEILLRDGLVIEYGRSPSFIWRIIIPSLELFLHWYFMWVIFAFMLQLRRGRNPSNHTGTGPQNNGVNEETEMINKI